MTWTKSRWLQGHGFDVTEVCCCPEHRHDAWCVAEAIGGGTLAAMTRVLSCRDIGRLALAASSVDVDVSQRHCAALEACRKKEKQWKNDNLFMIAVQKKTIQVN